MSYEVSIQKSIKMKTGYLVSLNVCYLNIDNVILKIDSYYLQVDKQGNLVSSHNFIGKENQEKLIKDCLKENRFALLNQIYDTFNYKEFMYLLKLYNIEVVERK